MSLVLNKETWQPSASIQNLKARAQFLHTIRQFFAQRDVMEVDTPLLSQGVATAPHLHSFAIGDRYLQTSPEFAMKRLLAAGSGPIYYLGKAFRQDEVGLRHNPEFTMLEWYRPGWDHYQLISEVSALFELLLGCQQSVPVTYAALFQQYFSLQPHTASIAQLQQCAHDKGWIALSTSPKLTRDGWLDLLFTHGIEPHLGLREPTIVLDFPASQASLAKVRVETGEIPYQVAERFEFYYRGLELANGYHELTCPKEQKQRFEEDLVQRTLMNLPILPMDNALLAALTAGLPNSAGVAIGVDRLLMLKLNENDIARVLPFGWQCA